MINEPSLVSACAAAIQKSVDFALRYDPATRNKLKALENCLISVEISSPDLTLFGEIKDASLYLRTIVDRDADVTISGDARDFLRLLGEQSPSFAKTNIRVAGKIHLLAQLKNIFSQLDVDWEDALSTTIGVLPANVVARRLRSIQRWLANQKSDIDEKLGEYLSEELRAVPSTTEAEVFYTRIDDIRADTQRLAAKLARLQNIITSKNNS